MLVRNSDTGLPKAVTLRCSLCSPLQTHLALLQNILRGELAPISIMFPNPYPPFHHLPSLPSPLLLRLTVSNLTTTTPQPQKTQCIFRRRRWCCWQWRRRDSLLPSPTTRNGRSFPLVLRP
ncbi:hypothetical protein NE237_025595 [Protea cynaroides]|uniref:Uncharacterized protein n=1 Tax=Protea cynaroides TaxID=273540 RepID=A0A9Q0H3F9_9MAGN|nr:hypothetical protein NE237_025595 [Protea cynaroides]